MKKKIFLLAYVTPECLTDVITESPVCYNPALSTHLQYLNKMDYICTSLQPVH